MQVIKMRMCNKYRIDRRKIGDTKSWTAQPLQQEQPLRKIRIDDEILSTNLQKETRVSDKRHAKLRWSCQHGLVRGTCATCESRVPDEGPELFCFATDCNIQHHLGD